MGEEKEKLDRLRAKRGGHRTVVTKNINEARTILEHTDLEDIMWSRLNVVEQIFRGNQRICSSQYLFYREAGADYVIGSREDFAGWKLRFRLFFWEVKS